MKNLFIRKRTKIKLGKFIDLTNEPNINLLCIGSPNLAVELRKEKNVTIKLKGNQVFWEREISALYRKDA